MFSLRHFRSQPNVRSPSSSSKSRSESGEGKGKSRSRTESLVRVPGQEMMRRAPTPAPPMPVVGQRILENWQLELPELAYAAPTPSVKPQYTPAPPPQAPAHTRSRSGAGFYIHVNEHLPEGMAPLPPPPRKVGFVYWNPEVASR